jgi:thiamine kinase-like enzyme
MLDIEVQIRSAFEKEQVLGRIPKTADDIPCSYEVITNEWLTAILASNVPGAKVVAHELGVVDSGTTDRRRIMLTYNDAGQAAGLPPTVFCKAANSLEARLLNARGGLSRGEYVFYSDFRDRLSIEAPICLYAAFDPETFNSITVLDDMARAGVTFCSHDTSMTYERARGQVRLLAQLHAPYYDSAEVARATGVHTFEELFANLDTWVNWQEGCSLGFERAEVYIPPALFARADEIWPATQKAVRLHGQMPRTFTHNDVHIRNWYLTREGAMGLSDWQCFGRGHWARDFAYAVSTALTVKDRRAWDRQLMQEYLDAFRAAGGPAMDFDDAWLRYRQHLPSVLAFWTLTIAWESTHPETSSFELTKRIATAMDDLSSLDSLPE